MTFDEFFRYVMLPALGAAALVGFLVSLREVRERWQGWRDGTL